MGPGVDRGGLSYPIDTSYDPSGVTDFLTDLALAKSEWGKFKGDLGSGAQASYSSFDDAQKAIDKLTATINNMAAAKTEAAETPIADAADEAELVAQTLAAQQLEAQLKKLAVAKSELDDGTFEEAAASLDQQRESAELLAEVAERRVVKKFEEAAIEADINALQADQLSFEERKIFALDKEQARLDKIRDRLDEIGGLKSAAPDISGSVDALGRARPLPDPAFTNEELNPQTGGSIDQFFRVHPLEDPKKGLSIPPPPPVPAETQRSWKDYFATVIEGSKDTNSSAGTLIATFERLFARVVIIGAIREVGREFKAFVGEMILANEAIETTTLGVSSLLLAIGHIEDATGSGVNGIRGFELATNEARKQINLLRVDALSTSTTFENLAKNFQSAVAPGLEAGLNLDEIRKLTLQFSQAANALNVPQAQIPQELRAILTGTINNRDNKIGTSLGITSNDIKLAKEAGTLTEFLTEKLGSFNTAGKAAQETFAVLWSNFKDAIVQIIGAGGLDFFHSIEGVLGRIQKTLVTIDANTGGVVLNPKAVAIVKEIANVLQDIVADAEKTVTSFGEGGLIAAAQGLAQTLKVVFEILEGGIEGTVAAFKVLGVIFADIKEAFEDVFGQNLFSKSHISEFVAMFVEVKLLLFVIATTLGTIISLASTLLGITLAIEWPMLVIAAALVMSALQMGALAEGARNLASSILGVNVSFETLIELIGSELHGAFIGVQLVATNVFSNITADMKIGFLEAADYVQTIFDKLFAGILQRALAAAAQIAKLDPTGTASRLIGTAGSLAGAVPDAQHEKRIEDIKAEQQALSLLNNTYETNLKLLNAKQDASDNRILAGNKDPGSFADRIKAFQDTLKSFVSGNFGGNAPTASSTSGGATKEATDLATSFENLPGIISPVFESVRALTALFQKLKEETITTNEALRDGVASLGASGTVLSEMKNTFDAINKGRLETKDLLRDQTSQEQILLGIMVQRKELDKRVGNQSPEDSGKLADAMLAGDSSLALLRTLSQTQSQIEAGQTKLQDARKEGNLEQISALEEEIGFNEEILRMQQDQYETLRNQTNQILEGSKNAPDLIKLSNALIINLGKERQTRESIAALQTKQLEVQTKLNAIADIKNQLLAKEASFALQNSNRTDAIKAQNDRAVFNTTSRNGPPALPEVTAFVQAQGELALLKEQVAQEQKLDQLKLANLDKQMEAAGDSKTYNALAQQRVDTEEQIAIKLVKQTTEIQKQTEKYHEQSDIINKPVSTGLLDGIRKSIQELPSLYTGIVTTIKSIVTGLTDFISTSIVDAFDPSKKQDLAQRFASFLQGLAKQVIDMFIHLALVQAALNLGFLGMGGVPGGGAPGGGLLGGLLGGGGGGLSGGLESPASGGGVSALGGLVRGMSTAFTGPYTGGSSRIAGAINLPSSPAHSLVARRQESQVAASLPQTAQAQMPIQTYVIANDQHLDRMLAGGKNAMFNFFQDNKSRIKGALGT